MKTAGIYGILCSANKRLYIGSSLDIESRWRAHRWHLRSNLHANSHLQNAWNKYGEESFVFDVLEVLKPSDQMHVQEQWWIDGCAHSFNIAKYAQPRMAFGEYLARQEKRLAEISNEDAKHPLIYLERHTGLGSTFVARLMGIAYPTYAAYRSKSRKLPLYHLKHVECLLALENDVLKNLIDEEFNGNR